MPWLTLVVATSSPAPSPTGPALAHSRLRGIGNPDGSLWALPRRSWDAVRAQTGVHVLRIWDRVVGTEGISGAYLSLSLSAADIGYDFDDPATLGAIRATLGRYLPVLGSRLVAVSTLMGDWLHCSGALTVFRAHGDMEATTLALEDPWRTMFTHRLFQVAEPVFRKVPSPPGPGTQRYGASHPWPGGSFS